MITPACTARAIASAGPNAGSFLQMCSNDADPAGACNGGILAPRIRSGSGLNHSFKFSLKPLPKRWLSNWAVVVPGGSVIFEDDSSGARHLGASTLISHLS